MHRFLLMGALLGVVAWTPGLDANWSAQDRAVEARPAPSQAERVDLNSANQQRLESLPGIGPRTAELIIEYRQEHGGFQKVEELMNIRGIGERTFLRLRELVHVATAREPN